MDWSLYLQGGGVILIFVTLVWFLSLALKNSAIMDIFWGLGVMVVTYFYGLGRESLSISMVVLQVLVLIWGMRLSLYIFLRNKGKPEDARYANWRRQAGKAWWWRSYLKVFLLQGVVMWIVSLHFFTGQSGEAMDTLGWLSYLGILLWVIGFFFETVGDQQMSNFKKNPANKGKVMASGLWKYTRHPNYFGEAVMWWGFTFLALESGCYLGILSAVVMTYILRRVSGVTMLDELMLKTKPGYKEYMEKTPAFIPWIPSKD